MIQQHSTDKGMILAHNTEVLYFSVMKKNLKLLLRKLMVQDDYVGKIVTSLEKETTFYIAEEYHHKYFQKSIQRVLFFSNKAKS